MLGLVIYTLSDIHIHIQKHIIIDIHICIYIYVYTHIHTVVYVCIVCTLFCTRLHLPYVVHITDVLKGIGFGSCGLGLVGSVRLGLHYCDWGLGFRFGDLRGLGKL